MPPVINAERTIESAPSKNPKAGPKTRALRIKINHIGSIPTAPVPSGRRAAMSADNSARSATDFASKSPLLTFAKKRRRAMGAQARKIHCGAEESDVTKNGQRKPRRLIALTISNVTALAAVKEIMLPVLNWAFIPLHPVLQQHRRQ